MKCFLLLTTLLIGSFSFSQIDFDNYSPIVCAGDIPDDFLKSSIEKVELENNESEFDELFLMKTRYSVDQILQSGRVLFNDPISEYVKRIAKILLHEDEETYSKLRFYTIKSRATNAFSTDQGIIFVTTGLISQVANEAQLAGIIAHEIAHFTCRHVHEGYLEEVGLGKKSRNFKNEDEKIIKLSTYSKEKEFEADQLGLEMAIKAGYSSESILNMFDVLLYSYLAFDEVEFDTTFYNSNYMKLEGVFTNKIPEITAQEEYNDEHSSHPNILKRKNKFELYLEGIDVTGEEFQLGENLFNEIKTIAQFESLRISVLQKDYPRALYEHFLLSKQFPKSVYLAESLSKIWYGVSCYKYENQFFPKIKMHNFEGEEYQLAHILVKSKKEELITIALRIIQDQLYKFPENRTIEFYRNEVLEQFANKITLKNFSNLTFEEFKKTISINNKDSLVDTSKTVSQFKDKKSKYDKIKSKKNKFDSNSNENQKTHSTFG